MPNQERGPRLALNEARNIASTGTNYIFAIGIDKYQQLSNLNNAVSDAQAVVKVLQERYTFEPENTIELYNNDATSQEIEDAFDELIKKVTDKDNVLIYFSGHGYFKESFEQGYWIPADGKYNNNRHYTSTYIDNDDIRNFIKKINSFHTLLIVDSCFAGSLFRKPSSNEVSDRLGSIPSRWGFTSGLNEPVLDGSLGGNSPFAKYLLEKLKENKEEKMMITEVIQYVKNAVGANAIQQPIGNPLMFVGDRGGMGEFVFFLRSGEFNTTIDNNIPNDIKQKPTKPKWEKKFLWVIPILLFLFCGVYYLYWQRNYLYDKRDGQIYPTIRIGDKRWMAKNLNVGKMIVSLQFTDLVASGKDSEKCYGDKHPHNQTNNGLIEKYCYENDPDNCKIYGGLYQWNEMMGYDNKPGSQGICPSGWHIPTDEEWKQLEMTLGMSLKETNDTGWRGTDQGDQLKTKEDCRRVSNCGISKFNALLGGYRLDNGTFNALGTNVDFWTSTESSKCNAWLRSLRKKDSTIDRNDNNRVTYHILKTRGRACRCVQDN